MLFMVHSQEVRHIKGCINPPIIRKNYPGAIGSPYRGPKAKRVKLLLYDVSVDIAQVFQWAGERPPDISCPLDCFSDRGTLTSYHAVATDSSAGDASGGNGIGPQCVVQTVSVQVTRQLRACLIVLRVKFLTFFFCLSCAASVSHPDEQGSMRDLVELLNMIELLLYDRVIEASVLRLFLAAMHLMLIFSFRIQYASKYIFRDHGCIAEDQLMCKYNKNSRLLSAFAWSR